MEFIVLNVANPFAAVGPDAVSEAEQLLTQLDTALVGAGSDSIVMACEGSVTEGILLATRKAPGVPGEVERRRIHEEYRFTLKNFVEKWPIDLVHMHGGDFYEYLPPAGIPVLVTLHLPLQWYPQEIFHIDRPRTFLRCVSAEQRSACPSCANLLPEIENANDLDPVRGYIALYERLIGEYRANEIAIPAPEEMTLALAHASSS